MQDPGIQQYGGELFRELRDNADDAFCKLPPPKPSCAYAAYGGGASRAGKPSAVWHSPGWPRGGLAWPPVRARRLTASRATAGGPYGSAGGGGGGGGGQAPAVSMASFHNSGNPCFDGRCLVSRPGGRLARVDSLARGDTVFCGGVPVRAPPTTP